MPTSLNKIKSIVKQKIGLDSSTIGESTLDKIINRRMLQCNIENIDSYYNFLNNNPEELNELLEMAVIPETWFFRDVRPFEMICNKIKAGLRKNKTQFFRILCIPCSTGEEPYSISMYLIDHGIPASAFSIDAVDVSERSLNIARQGNYSKNSFRGKDYHLYQERNFSNEDNTYSINKRFAEPVNFSSINILHGEPCFHNKFDFVLCRNLLIYFDELTKLNAFKQLEKFMKSDAILYIGHSEFGSMPDSMFKNTGADNAFGLIKKSQAISIIKKPIAKAYASILKKTAPKDLADNKNNNQSNISLDEIRHLADTKQFEEAERLCQTYIENNNEEPEAFYLLGLVSSCLNKETAAESLLRKALFLDPKHYDSLIHLSLILEQKGDIKNSDLLKKRAKKTLLNDSSKK